MQVLRLDDLNPVVAKRTDPFFREILSGHAGLIDSLYIVGSAITPDFRENVSDINSIIVLKEFDFGFMRDLGSIGRRHKGNRIAAPLLMTHGFIRGSLDVFPVEFHEFKTIHKAVYGADSFGNLPVERSHLRLQCEREIKTRLVALRQGYVSSLGEKDLLTEALSRSITGCFPLFRGILSVLGKDPPVPRRDVLDALQTIIAAHLAPPGISEHAGVFERVLALRYKEIKPSREELHALFENFYRAVETVDKLIDALHP